MNISIEEKQHEMLEILKEIKKICEENDIHFSLAYGTVLGAVRHKGFIPWDDDADITMQWDDYIKFLNIWNSFNKNEKYEIKSFENEKKYPFLYAKIISRNISLSEKILENMDLEYGVWVDVFPLIKLGNSNRAIKKQKRLLKWGNFIIHKYYYLSGNNYVKENHNHLKIKRVLFKLIPDRICFGLARNMIYKAATIGKSDMLMDMSYNDRIYYKTEFDNLIYIEFEDIKMPIMKNYEKYLENEYGDWKTPVNYGGHDVT